jgi:hypothetical protein
LTRIEAMSIIEAAKNQHIINLNKIFSNLMTQLCWNLAYIKVYFANIIINLYRYLLLYVFLKEFGEYFLILFLIYITFK